MLLTRIAEYDVEDALGVGGFAVVFRCRDPDGCPVAVKVYKRGIHELSSFELSLFQNEIEALIGLRHPSLVEVRGYGIMDDGHPYLVMELVEGMRLDQYVSECRRLDVIEAIQIARKIADALAHIHDRGILHLDLKPSNIVLTDPHEPALKLLDFGLATVTGIYDPARLRHRAGTPAYMAPELFAGSAPQAPDQKMDIYSLGLILYQMIAGEEHFRELQSRREKRYFDIIPLRELVPAVPRSVAALVHGMLARDPAARVGSAATVARQLRQLYFEALRGEGEPAPTPPARFLVHQTAPLIGRGAELARVRGLVDQTRRGSGGAVVITGPAGIGKSRLIAELIAPLERAGEVLLGYGRCRQLGGLVPFSPLREAFAQLVNTIKQHAPDQVDELRDRIGEVLRAEADVLCELVPELRGLAHSGVPVPADLASFRPVGAERVARAVLNLLAAFQADMPVVLAIEDIHWADAGTLGVLSQLVPRLRDTSTLLLCSSRNVTDNGARAQPWDVLLEGSPVAAVTVIELAPLDERESAELVSALGVTTDAELVTGLMCSVPLLRAGNPLCSSRLIHNLELEGYLGRTDDGALVQRKPIAHDYEPPDSVSVVLQRILRHLDEPTLDVLGVAALIGRQFQRSDLAALEICSDAELERALAQADRHALCHVGEEVCTFVHDTIRDELERHIARERLPELHRRIAWQLAASAAPPGALAHHLEAAGDAMAAADAYLRAGLHADRIHDCASAGRFLQHAARLLVTMPKTPPRDDLLAMAAYELARSAALAGDTGGVIEALDRCAEALGDARPDHRLALDSAYARVHYAQGNFPAAVQASRACLAVEGDALEVRRYQNTPANVLGRALSATGKFGPSIPVLQRGCELAREAREFVELSHSEGLLGVSLGFTGQHDRAREHVEAAANLADRLEDPVRIMGACFYRAAIAESSCDWETGAQQSIQLIRWADDHSLSGLYLYLGTMFAGRHHYHLGHLARARVLLLNAINLAGVLRIRIGLAWVYAFLGDVYFVSGVRERAITTYREGVTQGGGAGDDYGTPMCLIGLAHIAALGGDAAAARSQFDEAFARLQNVSNHCTQIAGLQRQAEALELLGDASGADASRTRREQLIRDTGGHAEDFWPRIPAVPPRAPGLEDNAAEPRQFWMAGWRQEAVRSWLSSAETVQVDATAGELFHGLSTVEGYMPTVQED